MNELKALYKVQNSGLPFVIFSEFGTTKVNVIAQSDKKVNFLEDFSTETGFVFAPFEKKLGKVLIKDNVKFEVDINSSFKSKIISINDIYFNKNNIRVDFSNRDKIEFNKKFLLSKNNIEKGIFDKVVISRREEVTLKDKFNLIDTYVDLILKNTHSYNYLFFHPKIGIWMGSTPELFVFQQGSKLSTNSLAGTKLVGEEWTEKEREEQKYVLDFIVDIFKKRDLKAFISQIEDFRYGNIKHLKNTIDVELKKDTDINDIIDDLHPTPAVCGTPRKNAYNFVLTKENYEREFYTGFLGYTSPELKKLYVNLRCMKFDLQKAYLYVGCGITEGSQFENEWSETQKKSEVLKSVL